VDDMSVAPVIPPALAKAQATASDPARSAWVSANAGSGKTHVLVQRVIRLLLDGVDPTKILCLTFTKAAAANMANKVFDQLAKWTALDDPGLDSAIAAIEGRRPPPARRLHARRLFAEALETPGGLKVQTIHAFCTALLHQFPFEADVAARFEVLEERAEAELIDHLRLEVLLEASGAPHAPLGRALATAIIAAADVTFADVIREAIGKRDALEGWIERAGGLDEAIAELSDALGVLPGDTQERIDAEIFASPHLPPSEWAAASAVFAQGRSTDRDNVARLGRAQTGADWEHVRAYLQIFCVGDLSPRKNVATNLIRDNHPDLYRRLCEEQTRVCALIARRRAVVMRDRTAALVRIAHEVMKRYRAEKERRGLLDYDDLIGKTLNLLSGDGSAAWVLYKLDLGIDHVLIDEAQDTSPRQWEVIRRLTAEFTAGLGARAVRRSIFAVGDEKQSIYSFQGAEPHRFDEMRLHFQRAHEGGGLAFERVDFRHSFRSAPDILAAVDAVFKRPQARAGLTAANEQTVHEAVRASAPGCVEIWPMIEPGPRPEIEPWDAPFDTLSEQSPRLRLARRIAASVKTWIARGERVAMTGERVSPGDVLVLVRQRGELFEAIIRALKDAGVEVAGADRLVLTEHIAVMDLMSLADALLLPADDLALAEALKSPLFGFDEEQLYALAYGRRGTLREALTRKAAADDPRCAAAVALLDELAVRAERDTPFDFYAWLLGAGGGRCKMLARLGLEAADALDELLSLALDFERRHTPSLQAFVASLRSANTEVKRDMDIVRNEVRVMTVHGAKGLEAPIVILADTTTNPAGPREPRLLTLAAPAGSAPETPAPLAWVTARAEDVPTASTARASARAAAEDEHRRLLYVALTRAADRLVVCGARGEKPAPAGCWYELVHDALASGAATAPADAGEGDVWRWQKSPALALVAAETSIADTPAQERPDPAWLGAPVAREIRAATVLRPSAAYAASSRFSGGANATDIGAALLRGSRTHRLLEALPAVPAAARAAVARAFLGRTRPPFGDADEAATIAEVLAVLDDPTFAPLFAAGTRGEAPVVGRITTKDGRAHSVSGQIDRLAVTPEAVLIADFKTDRAPPGRAEDVSMTYRVQLALYRAVLGRIYPGRAVRAALVFTQTPQLIELPDAMLEEALATL
jgi:ATP-dependent helicase/nuclease subunit A